MNIEWNKFYPPNVPLLDTKLPQEVVDRLWEYINEAEEDASARLAGNITDAKDLIDRDGGGVANKIGTALGIAGVNAPAPKVYEIMSGGVADGVLFPFETMHAFKIAELAKYSLHNPEGMYTTAFAVIMNDDTYNDLSASHKKCIDDMRGVSLSRKIGNYWDKADDVGRASAADYNHELTVASTEERQYFRDKMGPVIDEVLSSINSVGVDANAALAYFKEQVKVENALSGN